MGEVVDVRRSASGEYFLNIRYVPGRSRKGLDAALHKLFEAHRHEKSRRYPRVPVHLKAQGTSQAWSVRDLSRGGAGVELETGELPRDARLGVPVLLELQLDTGRLLLHGAAVWLTGGTSRPKTPPALGVEFGRLGLETLRALDRVLVLDGFPAGTVAGGADLWDGCGGEDAVARSGGLLLLGACAPTLRVARPAPAVVDLGPRARVLSLVRWTVRTIRRPSSSTP